MQRLVKKLVPCCFALMLTLAGGAATATAGNYCYEPPACTYRTVTVWVKKVVPYKTKVIRYRPCGTPYYVWKTYPKTIKVPVTYRVKICD